MINLVYKSKKAEPIIYLLGSALNIYKTKSAHQFHQRNRQCRG